jgi:hypothetical protein
MLRFFVVVTAILTVADAILWVRFLRPTPVVWERRNRLIAASLGLVPPLIFIVLIAQSVGIFK